MILVAQNILNHPNATKAFDWSIFSAGMASLVFAVAMTVLTAEKTRNADASLAQEIRTNL